MNRLNRGQKDKVGTMRSITGCNDKVAIECLNAGGWSVEGAVEVTRVLIPSRKFLTPPPPCPSGPLATGHLRISPDAGQVRASKCRRALAPRLLLLNAAFQRSWVLDACPACIMFGCQVFYSSGMSASVPSAPRLNTGSIQQLFNRYADPTDGVILADGVGRFCDDLKVRLHVQLCHSSC